MVQLEKRLLWHPRKENKFVVGENSQISLYEWASEHPEIRHITSHHGLHSMKCFAWSPDPVFDDLIAVGLSTGKVDLIRLKATKQSQRKHKLSNGPSVTLPIRTPRACHSLAFSSANPNYLAVGLEKVRGDAGVIIWDISNVLPSLWIPLLESNESTNTNNLSFNQLQPLPQIPRIDNHTRNDSRILQQHATAETVCSLAFLPSSAHLLLSNISNRFLRLFDLRAPSIPPLNIATKLNDISVDSFDNHRIASFGDSTVTIWDIRKFLQPIMAFSERDALADGAKTKQGSSYINIEFSSTRRGTIATLEKESTYVRFWDLAESRVSALDGGVIGGGGSSDGETNKNSRESNRGARRSWANLPWPGGGEKERLQHHGHPSKEGDLTSSMEHSQNQQTFVLSDTHRTKYFPRPLASFALAPNSTPGNPHPLTSNVMVVNRDGDLELYAIHDTPKQLAWSARGDFALGAGLGLKVLEGYRESENDDEEDRFVPDEPKQRKSSRDTSSRGRDASRVHVSERDLSPGAPITRGRDRQGAARRDSHASLPTLSLTTVSPTSATTTPGPTSAFFGQDEDGLSTPGPSTTSASNRNAPSTATSSKPTGLSTTRPRSSKQSPAVGKYVEGSEERQSERSVQVVRSVSRADTLPADDMDGSRGKYGGKSVSTVRGGKGGDGLLAKSTSRSRDARGREAGKKTKEAGVVGLIRDDISMIIRRRAKAGYGLSQLQHNIIVTQDRDLEEGESQTLSEFWAWLYHSQEIFSVPTARLHGYDFSFQGLLGIWEGLVPMPNPPQPPLVGDAPITMQQTLLFDLPTIANPPYPGYINHSHTTSIGSTASISSGSSGVTTNLFTHRNNSPADALHGNWPAALAALGFRRGSDTVKSNWKPAVQTSKLLQRQIALQIIGWSLRDDELSDAIKRWQKEGQFARAACWLVFTRQYGKAVELLMRSDDETHQMMSGTIAALAPLMSATGPARGLELRELYGRLIIKLHDPYFRMLLTHLSTNEWSEVLDEDFIPFRERLAIGFQFLDDKALSSYLRRLADVACEDGSIEGLILTGLTPSGMRVIQSYLDHTGDVQSAAILSSYVCPHRFKDKRVERWLESYRDLLDGFKLHHLRVGFDIERGQILHEATQNGNDIGEWAPKQILIRCHYCNKAVDEPVPGILLTSQQSQKGRPTQCSNCNRELPRCAVCLMTLSIVGDAAREAALGYSHNRDTFDDAIVICQTCRHGGHAIHILEWFLGEDGRRTHSICPVADCNCKCADEF